MHFFVIVMICDENVHTKSTDGTFTTRIVVTIEDFKNLNKKSRKQVKVYSVLLETLG